MTAESQKLARVRIFTDGGSRGNPGPGACAAVLFDEKGSLVREEGRYLGRCTNNFAEYNGLILALALAGELGVPSLEIFSDSELLVRQFNGQYRVKDPALKVLMEDIRKSARSFVSITVAHVRRGANEHADRLVNSILDSHSGETPRSGDAGRGHGQPELF